MARAMRLRMVSTVGKVEAGLDCFDSLTSDVVDSEV